MIRKVNGTRGVILFKQQKQDHRRKIGFRVFKLFIYTHILFVRKIVCFFF